MLSCKNPTDKKPTQNSLRAKYKCTNDSAICLSDQVLCRFAFISYFLLLLICFSFERNLTV